MLLSLKHKFIFIHIPKTGGTSIRKVLEGYSDDIRPHLTHEAEVMVAKRQASGLSVNPPHATLTVAAKMLNLDLKDYMVVCVVRHPVERLISFYKYLKHIDKNHRLHLLADNLAFDSFVESFIVDRGNDTKSQFSYIAPTEDLTVKGHYVLRYENLEQDFAQIQSFLGLPSEKLPRLNQSTKEKIAISEVSKKNLMAFEAQTVELAKYT